MCRINFNLEVTTPNSEVDYTVNGKYRVIGTTNWTNFTITDITRPGVNVTTGLGDYELKVFIELPSGVTNESETVNFKVTSDCGGVIESYNCQTITFERFPDVNPIIDYIDCNGNELRYDEQAPILTFDDGTNDSVENSPTFKINCVHRIISLNGSVNNNWFSEPTPDFIPCGLNELNTRA